MTAVNGITKKHTFHEWCRGQKERQSSQQAHFNSLKCLMQWWSSCDDGVQAVSKAVSKMGGKKFGLC